MPTTGDFPLQLSLPTGADPVDVSVLNANFEKVNDYAGENDTDIAAITANNWVSTSRIADSAVTTAKIANANVTAAKLEATLNLTGKTVSVAAPSAGAHATTKTYVDAQDAATLASANTYADGKIPGYVVLASGSWSGAAPTVPTLTTTNYRQLVVLVTLLVNGGGFSEMTVSFTGLTSYDQVISSFGSTSLTTSTAQTSLNPGTMPTGTGFVVEVDYPGLAIRKTITGRSNVRTISARSTNAAAVTGVTFTVQGSASGASGTYEVIGVR
jgi:hypothetical protein